MQSSLVETTLTSGWLTRSPGFLDIQINGAYGVDFSVYEGDDGIYRDGLKIVAEKIVETGVTSQVYG